MNFKRLSIIFFGMSGRYTVTVLEKIATKHNLVGIVESAPRHMAASATLSRHVSVVNRALTMMLKAINKSYRLSDIAKKNNIPYFYLTQGNRHELENWLISLGADIGCVASFSQLLKPNIIEIFPKGIINLHPSILPKYRGPNPWFWTYFEMEKTGGVTVHYIDAGEDTGDILLQAEFPIPLGMPFRKMHDTAIRLGTRLTIQALDDIAMGIQQTTIQRHLKTFPRARNIKRNEYLIDWENWPIERVWHVLRGSQQWLDAFPFPPVRFGGMCSWQIEGYEKGKILGGGNGKISKDSKGWYIALPEGKIRLKVNFSPKKFLLGLLRNIS